MATRFGLSVCISLSGFVRNLVETKGLLLPGVKPTFELHTHVRRNVFALKINNASLHTPSRRVVLVMRLRICGGSSRECT